MSHTDCRGESPRGTSLLESCVALVLLGTLATLAVPPLIRAQQAYGLSAVANRVRTDLNLARVQSVMRNQDCRLRVTSTTTYLIECQAPNWVTIANGEMPSGFTITANNRPEFHPLGNVAPMATVSVWNPRGATRRIVVSRGGRIRTE